MLAEILIQKLFVVLVGVSGGQKFKPKKFLLLFGEDKKSARISWEGRKAREHGKRAERKSFCVHHFFELFFYAR
jgi:hypothetical protein